MSSDLHAGFADANRSATPQSLYEFLNLVNDLPDFRAYKHLMRTHLALQPGETLLDVGCGVGIEACRIAHDRPDTHVIGLDREAMLSEAAARASDQDIAVRWLEGQAESIPLPDESVDACMTERVLKYLPDPARGIAEMVRVLKSDGRVACFELDYAATILGGDPNIATLVANLLNDSVGDPRMGRRLPTLFHAAGLVDVTFHPVIFSPPWPVHEATIGNPVRAAIARGDLASDPTLAWLDSQAAAHANGLMYLTFVGFVVTGRLLKRAVRKS